MEKFDAVVVGSGFGGGVSALRLADSGCSTLVLERGKAYAPGDFPRTPRHMSANFWDPSEGLHGLFDLWSFRGIEAVVAAGLGGGSLIYANVLIRKDEESFVTERPDWPGYSPWPVTRADLEPHYDAVEGMLGANPYPTGTEPYASTPKTLAHQHAAQATGREWFLPDLAVSFGDPPRPGVPVGEPSTNLHGRQRFACRLCGECDIGCNFGSKNTIDLTYLSQARDRGAEIRTRCEVRAVAPHREGGYTVAYVSHDPGREGRPTDTSQLPTRHVHARVVVLAAGTLGSTYLLLRSRGQLRGLSPRLGTGFSGNGDLLGTVRSRSRDLHPDVGPVITSTMRVPDPAGDGPGRGFYLQEGGYPNFASWAIEAAGAPANLVRLAAFALDRVIARLSSDPRSRISNQLSQLLAGGTRSARQLPLLGMGFDTPDGTISLRDGRWLDIDWTTRTSKPFFDRVESLMGAVARALDGRLVRSPLSYLGRVVTVHPLGGCPMGTGPEDGVVDDHGEVFGHPGLFVADGSVMPGPVGPNPSLTIAALAERFSARMTQRAAGE